MRRIGRGRAVAAVLAASTGLAGCGGSGTGADVEAGRPADFEATPAYLTKAVDRSMETAYRFEGSMALELSGAGESVNVDDTPILSGEEDGDRSHSVYDLRAFLEGFLSQAGEDLPPELEDADLTMEYIVIGADMYMRVPFYAAIQDQLPPGAGAEGGPPVAILAEAFGDLGDRWGHVDLDSLGGDLPLNVRNQITQGQGFDPREFLEIVRDSDTVEELDGGPFVAQFTGLGADVTLDELFEAQGTDAETTREQFRTQMTEMLDESGDLDTDDANTVVDVLLDMRFQVEVWLDADGFVRHINFTMDMGEIFQRLADTLRNGDLGVSDRDLEDLAEVDSFAMRMSVRFSDYGDESIEIEPPSGDTVDVTEDFVELVDELSAGS